MQALLHPLATGSGEPHANSPFELLLSVIGTLEQNVPIHPHVEFVADRDFNCRLDIEIATCHLGAEFACFATHGTGEDVSPRGVGQEGPVAGLREVRGCGKETGQDRESNETLVVTIHLVAEPRLTSQILADHAAEVEGRRIGIDDAMPDYLDSVLTVANLRTVEADEARALRDEEVLTITMTRTSSRSPPSNWFGRFADW